MSDMKANAEPSSWDVEVFYDGACPLCMREIAMIQRWDAPRRRIRFTDIASPSFDASSLGVSWPDLMARIHGRLPDGQLIEGVEVFRCLYAAVGFDKLVAISRWPGVAWLCAIAYTLFAKNRLRLTGRCVADCQLPPGAGHAA